MLKRLRSRENGFTIVFAALAMVVLLGMSALAIDGGVLFTDNLFHNNGLDSIPSDGLYSVTENPWDKGKYKTPTLRNIALTAPYMHDGRFQTLEEVVKFYSEEVQSSPTIDPLMYHSGYKLSKQEQSDLVAFLKTLTDEDFVTNPAHSNPFEE